MTFRHIALGLALSVAAYGVAAAKDLKITPMPQGEGQGLAYVRGHPTLISQKARGIVVLSLTTDRIDPRGKVPLVIGVENKSAAPINFAAANISVTTDKGPTRILSVSDLQAEGRSAIRKQVFWASVGAFGSSLQAAGADDAGERAQADFEGQRSLAQGRAARASEGEMNAQAEEQGFRPATLASGAHVLTPMPVAPLPSKASSLTVTVELNGESHVFNMNVTPGT